MRIVAKRLDSAVNLRTRQIHVRHQTSARRDAGDDAPLLQVRS